MGSIGAFLGWASRAVHGMGAWVHGMVPGGILGLLYLLGVPEPVTSLMGGCHMKWILVFLYTAAVLCSSRAIYLGFCQ